MMARAFFSVGDDDSEAVVIAAFNSSSNNDNCFGIVDGYAYFGNQPNPNPKDRSLRDISTVAIIILASRQGGGGAGGWDRGDGRYQT
jgi:hypothetical protein